MSLENRYLDARHEPAVRPKPLPPLPKIDWAAIGASAPRRLDLGNPSPDACLPQADVVVITWTNNEWNALDHVFLSSDKEAHVSSERFRDAWHMRRSSGGADGSANLWGYYALVEITNAAGNPVKVLLWKANMHLAHPPWLSGLGQMVDVVLGEAKPKRLYSIGTAGGATASEKLGDSIITNAGSAKIVKGKNKQPVDLDGKCVSCTSWFPNTDLVEKVQDNLLFKLSDVATDDQLQYFLSDALRSEYEKNPEKIGAYTLASFKNAALEDLSHPKGWNKKDIPLLTTDYYFIADGSDASQYSALEMDDAVVGYFAGQANTDYAFIRNISDPIVPVNTQSGEPIPTRLREDWSSLIYTHYGFYSSMNGALITWSTLVADKDL